MARLKHTAVGLACLVACGAAMADPISLIASAVAYVAPQYALAAFVAASVIGVASQRRKQRKAAAAAKAEYNASLTDRTVTILNTEAPHQIVYGSPAPFGGAIVADMVSGDRDQYHHQVYVFAACSLTSIDAIYIDGIDIGALDGAGWVTGGTFSDTTLTVRAEARYFDGSGLCAIAGLHITRVLLANTLAVGDAESVQVPVSVTYDSGTDISLLTAGAGYTDTNLFLNYEVSTLVPRLNVSQHLSPGGVDTADAYFISACPDKWTSAHKLSGYSYLCVTTDLTLPRFQNGPPAITIKAKGKAVYDPRTGLTAYSANPILCRADFIMSEQGWGATVAQIESAAWIAAANACDVVQYGASDQTANTTVIYSCDGVFRTDQDRETTLQQLEDCCAGNTHESGGVWRLMAGAWSTPVMALTDDDLMGPLVVQQASYTAKERYNGARGQYCDWRNLGVAGDFTPFSNSTFLSDDGTPRTADISLPFTNSHQRAIQLARVTVEKSRGGLVISYPAHMRCWPLQPGDRVTVTNAEFGFSAKNFRVSDWQFNLSSPVGLELIEDEESFYDPADDVVKDAAPNTDLPDPFAAPSKPTGVTAESGTDQLIVQAGGIITRVLVSWNATTNSGVLEGGYTEVRWKRAAESDWIAQQVRDTTQVSAYLVGPLDGENILIQVRFVTRLNASDFETIAHTVIGKTELPAAPGDVAVTPSLLIFTHPQDVDVVGYAVRYNVGTDTTWSVGTPLHQRVGTTGGLISGSPWPMPVRLYGINTVMVISVDSSGNESVAASDTQDFGQPDAANIADEVDFEALGWSGDITNGTISGTDIVADADPAADIYGAGSGEDIYYRDGAADIYGGSQYLALNYTATYASPYTGGTIYWDQSVVGPRFELEYRTDGAATGDIYSGTDIYAGTAIYGPEQSWKPWNGSLTPTIANVGYQFRITTDAGSVQGVIDTSTIRTEMPTIEQTFGRIAVSAGGTFVPPAAGLPPRTWIAIEDVQITPLVDGSGAIAGRVKSAPNPLLGPEIELLNSAATAVSGTAYVRVSGY